MALTDHLLQILNWYNQLCDGFLQPCYSILAVLKGSLLKTWETLEIHHTILEEKMFLRTLVDPIVYSSWPFLLTPPFLLTDGFFAHHTQLPSLKLVPFCSLQPNLDAQSIFVFFCEGWSEISQSRVKNANLMKVDLYSQSSTTTKNGYIWHLQCYNAHSSHAKFLPKVSWPPRWAKGPCYHQRWGLCDVCDRYSNARNWWNCNVWRWCVTLFRGLVRHGFDVILVLMLWDGHFPHSYSKFSLVI